MLYQLSYARTALPSVACLRASLSLVVGRRRDRRLVRPRRRLPDRPYALPRPALARRVLPRRLPSPARGADRAGGDARAPLPPGRAPAPERRPRRVGPAPDRPRPDAGDGPRDRAHPRREGRDAPAGRASRMARGL